MAEILRRLAADVDVAGGRCPRWEALAGDRIFRRHQRIGNALQGQEQSFTEQMSQAYLKINNRNAQVLNLDADLVMVHDHEPAALIEHRKGGKWIWRCYLDLSQPQRRAWSFLRHYVVRYDAAIFSVTGFAQRLPIPKFLIYPSIDPLSVKNREMSRVEVNHMMDRLGFRGTSRFCCRWRASIALKIRSERSRPTEWLRNISIAASSWPAEEWPTTRKEKQCSPLSKPLSGPDPDIHVLQLPPEADSEINALQRAATIVLQKSIKEGFGLAVSEAMWKGKPVVGGTAGGIAEQIIDGVTGYTVHSIEGAALRVRHLLNNPG